jgi:capsular exopolysaccharide synthesis family protein
LRTINDAPSSPYAEAIRAIKLTVDHNLRSERKDTKVLGLTSCLPSEGKSTIAAAMAALIAQSGARVILVDCDLRNPTLSRTLAPDAHVGFLDVVAGNVALTDAIWSDPTTNMAFLPMVSNPLLPNGTESLGSEAARSIFDTLQIKFDYVIVDLAPLVAAVDVRATSHFIDSYVLVIEWGTTKLDAVQYALRQAPGLQENIVGTVLNKVDMAALGHYDSYGAKYYYGQPSNAA